MYYKPRSIYRPDYFAKQTSKWILFPYEKNRNDTSYYECDEKRRKEKKRYSNVSGKIRV